MPLVNEDGPQWKGSSQTGVVLWAPIPWACWLIRVKNWGRPKKGWLSPQGYSSKVVAVRTTTKETKFGHFSGKERHQEFASGLTSLLVKNNLTSNTLLVDLKVNFKPCIPASLIYPTSSDLKNPVMLLCVIECWFHYFWVRAIDSILHRRSLGSSRNPSYPMNVCLTEQQPLFAGC